MKFVLDDVKKFINESNSLYEVLRKLKLSRTKTNTVALKTFIEENSILIPTNFGIRKSNSIMALVSFNDLQSIIDSCHSMSHILELFNLRIAGSNLRTLRKILSRFSFDYTKYEDNKRSHFKSIRPKKDRTYEEIKKLNFGAIRRYIKRNNLIEYKCLCGNNGLHLGKPLTLELDHIDGDRNNNELANLRFLCPNCHSQTETFSGKNNKKHYKKKLKFCSVCNSLITASSTGLCVKCSANNNRKLKFDVSKEELYSLISKHSLLEIGRMFSVSDNAIRKRCNKFGIKYKTISKYSHNKKRIP